MIDRTISTKLCRLLVGVAVAGALGTSSDLTAQQDAAKVGEGAQVYAANCARCHNPRSGAERTDPEWIPIVAHMRARANLTKGQAEAVLAFLQATNLPPTGGGAGSPAASVSPADGAGAAAPAQRVLPPSLRASLLPQWARATLMRLELARPDAPGPATR